MCNQQQTTIPFTLETFVDKPSYDDLHLAKTIYVLDLDRDCEVSTTKPEDRSKALRMI